MAYESLGQTFLPRFEINGGAEGSGRLEDVLRVLSFRLPRILGAKPVAPRALLESKGSAGDPLANAIVTSVLSTVLRGAPGGTSLASSVGDAPDLGAPSPFSKFFAPLTGNPGTAPQSPAQLPPPPKPRVEFADEPVAGRGAFRQSFADGQRSGRRRV